MPDALPHALPAANRAELTARLRQRLADGRAQLRERYLSGLPARRMLRGQASLTDGLLREAWRHVQMPKSAALLAVGGLLGGSVLAVCSGGLVGCCGFVV